jgi:cyanophycinase
VVGAAAGGGRVSIHLVGGGWSEDYDGEVYRAFLVEAAARALLSGRDLPRIGVLLVREDEQAAADRGVAYSEQLRRVSPCEPTVTSIVEGELFASAALSDIDGLLVGGGNTPAYLDAVTPIIDEIRLLVGDGLPYLGFSAGAMIAADAAIIGGWRIGEIEVCGEDAAEDLDEVTVVEGLGLVDLAIDVHAAQWGTLSRLVAATEALVDGGLAIDEFTVLIVEDDGLRVVGSGSVWQVIAHDDGVLVSTIGA